MFFAFYALSVRGLFREVAFTFSVLEQVKKKIEEGAEFRPRIANTGLNTAGEAEEWIKIHHFLQGTG